MNAQQDEPGQVDSLQLSAPPLSADLSAVTVVARKRQREALSRLRAVEGTAIYAGRKTEVVAVGALTVNKATNQARQIFAEVSGINVYESDDAGLQLSIAGRGLDPNRTASFNVRQNGYDISADVLGYPESYYTPPAEALRRIEVVRGAASLQYGTQFGGLLNFVFHEPARDRQIELISRQTLGSYGLFTSFNSLSGQVGPAGYYGFYNHKRGDGFRPNSGFTSHNAHLHIDIAPASAPNTTLSAEYTYLDYLAQQAGGLTDAQFYRDPLTSNRARNWFDVRWNLWNVGLRHRFSDRTRLSVDVFGLDARRRAVGFRTNRVSQPDEVSAPRDLLVGTFHNYGTEARLLHRYARRRGLDNIVLIGLKAYRADNSALQGPGTVGAGPDFTLADEEFDGYPFQSDFDFPNRNLALFGEHIFQLGERWSLTPGARFEYIRTESAGSFRRIDFDLAGNVIRDERLRDDRVFERRLLLLGMGLSLQASERTDLYANLSQNYRSVTFNDIRVVNPSFRIDPDIRDERGYTADVGLRSRPLPRLRMDAGLFAIRYGNRLGEVLTAEGNAVVRLRGNIGTAYLYGLESLLEYRLLDATERRDRPYALTLFANTSLTGSRYVESDIPGVEGKRVEFVAPVNLRTGLRCGYGNLLASLQYSYLSRQFTDATNAPQDVNDNQRGIEGAIPAYGVADLSLSYRWRQWTLESGATNLFDNRYFTRRATGYPGPGIIPAAPRSFYLTLGVRLSREARE